MHMTDQCSLEAISARLASIKVETRVWQASGLIAAEDRIKEIEKLVAGRNELHERWRELAGSVLDDRTSH